MGNHGVSQQNVVRSYIGSGLRMNDWGGGSLRKQGLTVDWLLSESRVSSMIVYLNESYLQGGRTRRRIKL